MRNVLLAAVLILATGCGPANTDQSGEVTGRVTQGGQPLQVQGREVGTGMVQIGFWAIADDGKQSTQPWEARVDADGKFRLFGRDGHGIPPGKYRIAVRQWEPYPGTDKLGGKFDEKSSPILRDITEPAEIVIELDRPGA